MTNQENAKEQSQASDKVQETVAVKPQELAELPAAPRNGDPIGLAQILEVPVRLTVEVGRTRLSLAELIQLGPGSLLVLDREAHEPADILVNGKIVARGEVVTIDESYGVRITSVKHTD